MLQKGFTTYTREEAQPWGLDNENIDAFNEVRAMVPEVIAFGYEYRKESTFVFTVEGGDNLIRLKESTLIPLVSLGDLERSFL